MTTRQKSGLAAYVGSLIAVLGMIAAYFSLSANGGLNAGLLAAAVLAFIAGAMLVSTGIVGIRKSNK